jgi:hypothetical protein
VETKKKSVYVSEENGENQGYLRVWYGLRAPLPQSHGVAVLGGACREEVTSNALVVRTLGWAVLVVEAHRNACRAQAEGRPCWLTDARREIIIITIRPSVRPSISLADAAFFIDSPGKAVGTRRCEISFS